MPAMNEQIRGRNKIGRHKSAESRRKRKKVFQIALKPKVKVNSVMKVEMTSADSKMASAGPNSLIFFTRLFFINKPVMIKFIAKIYKKNFRSCINLAF